jgi:short-subunit dehydrogenase
MTRIELQGKPIAITGASSGIGRATALACARAGMPVAIGARRADRLEALVREIEAMGGRALAISTDVDNPEDCMRLIDRTVEHFGSIYSVFANAGYGNEGLAHELTDEQLHAIFRTNFFGSMWTVRPAIEHMLRAGGGHVIMCSSCVSKLGLPMHAAYSASKALQDHFGRAMRIELAPKGIHVSTVHPIGTKTEFSEKVQERSGAERQGLRTPKWMVQDPSVVGDAIVASLRKPRGEIWTSVRMRLTLALATAFPALGDRVLTKRFRRKKIL